MIGKSKEIFEAGDVAHRRARPVDVVLHGRRIRGIALPASPLAARTGRPCSSIGDVTELPGHRMPAVHELPVHEHAHADPLRYRNCEQMPDVLGVPAEPQLRQRARVRRVLHRDGQPDGRFDERAEIDVAPAEVRREHQPAGRADSSRQADPHTLAHDPRVRASHGRHGAGQLAHERLGRMGRGPRRLLHESGVDASKANRCRLRPQLHGHDARTLDIEVQRPGTPAARRRADGAFGHPALIDQLIDDRRDRAALQAGSPRQIRAGHRGMPSDEVERDATVDLAGRFARRDLEVGEVDLAHRVGALCAGGISNLLFASRTIVAPCQFVNNRRGLALQFIQQTILRATNRRRADQFLAGWLGVQRFRSALPAIFGSCGAAQAFRIYDVTACSVADRTREGEDGNGL